VLAECEGKCLKILLYFLYPAETVLWGRQPTAGKILERLHSLMEVAVKIRAPALWCHPGSSCCRKKTVHAHFFAC